MFLVAKLLYEPICPSVTHTLTHKATQGYTRFSIYAFNTTIIALHRKFYQINFKVICASFTSTVFNSDFLYQGISVCLSACLFTYF